MADWQPDGFLMAAGTRLHYRCFGPAPSAAPTIVMLHEGLGSAGLWHDFPQKLSDATGMGVMAYSRAGYGQSDPASLPRPLDYLTREAVDVLPVVLERTGFERGILLGHSDGATIAAIYAGSVEDYRVRGIVLMAPHFFTEPMGLAAIDEAKQAFRDGDLRERLAKHHNDVDHTFMGWNDVWLDPAFARWNVSDVIDHLRIPALAIQGRQDQYGTLAQIEELDSRAYSPVDVTVLDGCKHAPHQDQPEQTLAAIAEFAARLERIEAAQVQAA